MKPTNPTNLTLWQRISIFLKGGSTERKDKILARYHEFVSSHAATARQLSHERACLTAYEAKLSLVRDKRGSNTTSGIPSGLL
jgi:hypothetical protein